MIVTTNTVISVILLLVGHANSARILCIFPALGHSNFLAAEPLIAELASRGHKLTVVSVYQMWVPNENVTEIRIPRVIDKLVELGLPSFNHFEQREQSLLERVTRNIYFTTIISNHTLASPELENLFTSQLEFDLFILDQCYSDVMLGFAHYFKVPTVVFNSQSNSLLTNEMIKNRYNSAYTPGLQLNYSDHMTLGQRLANTLMGMFEMLTYKYLYVPSQEAIYNRFFSKYLKPGDTLPNLIDLIHNVSYVLVNAHPALEYPRPQMPNIEYVGGLHIPPELDSLPEHILKYLDDAPKGVVYMSMGTNIRVADIPKEKLDAIVSAFRSLMGTVRVIMKFEDAILEEQPNNMVVGPWMPQKEILAHPNVRVFITHCGISSLLEAIHYTTPIVGIPLIGEQEFNAVQVDRYGLGRIVDFSNITEQHIKSAIEDVLFNPVYMQNMLKYRRLLNDNAVKPLDRAVWAVEHVLRTQGAPHLRAAVMELSWFQENLIDVSFIILFGVSLIFLVPSLVICIILRRSHAGDQQQSVGRKKKNN